MWSDPPAGTDDLTAAARDVQLALDVTSLPQALAVTAELHDLLHRIEVGTPLMLAAGADAVRALRDRSPAAFIVADVKVCDAGHRIADHAFTAGADAVTVIPAVCDEHTRLGVLDAAAAHTGTVVVDTLGLSDHGRPQVQAWVDAAAASGVRIELCVHKAKRQARGATAALAPWAGLLPPAQVLLAGRVDVAAATDALLAGAGGLIVGGAVTAADHPRRVWTEILHTVAQHRSTHH